MRPVDEHHIVRDLRTAAVLFHPMRMRILEHLVDPDTAAGVARHLRLPRQKVNYHLRQLEARGLVRLVEERTAGNSTERRVQAAARRIVLSPRLLGRLAADREDGTAEGTARLLAVAARLERQVPEAGGDGAAVLDADLRLEPEEVSALREDLRRVLARWSARGGASGGTSGGAYRVTVAVHAKSTAHASLPAPRAGAAGNGG